MTKSSQRRKSLRAMYKWNKQQDKAATAKKPIIGAPKAPFLDNMSTFRTPKIKRALSRVIEFEAHRPGEFAKWIDDLHIEHFRANIQERLEKRRNEKERGDSKEQAVTESEIGGLVEITGS